MAQPQIHPFSKVATRVLSSVFAFSKTYLEQREEQR